MRIRYLTCGLIQLMLMGLVGPVTAETRHLKCTLSVTGVDGVENHLDTNGDNVPDTVTTASRSQSWDYDMPGNWDSVPRPAPEYHNRSENWRPTLRAGHLHGYLFRCLGCRAFHLQRHV